MLKIATVNVNGIRAAFRKGMDTWLEQANPDVVLAQEVRASEEITSELFGDDWQVAVNASQLKGRAGVAVAVRKSSPWRLADSQADTVPVEVPQDGGRWLEAVLTRENEGGKADAQLRVISAYFHSGEVGTEKQDHKMAHLERIEKRLEQLMSADASSENTEPLVLVAGDFNVVHTELDIKNWKPNHNKRAGVLDEEIAFLDHWREQGWVDVVRNLAGQVQGPYSWWSWRGKAFDNNAGWRIDYQLATPRLAQVARSQQVDRAAAYDQRFSDHAPVVVSYEI
ncbi:exodeoxyribonuclease III [Varibaculum cambriense]|uniref:exodeoxyribonuclease III n=1 Tax=Varibaculum cambriense TaxID=184870 RepID=UPI00290CADCE|nr:exodeoxyribonuclease III [Varibaculum cambriense]MDU3273877.1 exodeoxyribonuclease III [Varibaculum cambriense]